MVDDRQAYREHGWWREETFLDDLRRHADRTPGKTAAVVSGARGVRALDYAELARLTDRCAGALLELGVQRGEMVAIHLTNRWELAPLMLGCMRAGVEVATLLPNYRSQNVRTVLELTHPRVLITMTENDGYPLGAESAQIAAEVPGVDHVIAAAAPGSADEGEFEKLFFGTAWEDKHQAELDRRELGPDDPFILFFTSGTTGEPKGAVHTLNTLHAAIRGEAGVFDLDENTVMATMTINTHYTGMVQGMFMPLMLGGTMAYLDVPESGATLDLFARAKVNTMYVAPWFLRDLLDEQQARPRDLSSLRWVICGSAPVSPHLIEEVARDFGLPLFSLWGMTENGPVTITRPSDPPDWAAHSDGSPIADMELLIKPMRDHTDGEGVLWVRGPTQCLGYYHRDELYAAALDEDGWFDTGDIVRPDGRGGIRVTGRAEETIFKHAVSVPISQLETTIQAHPLVHRAAVIGLPAGGGEDEIICAVVVPAGQPITLEELRDHVREAGVMDLHWPERVEIVAELPVTLTGKIRKVELKQRFGDSHQGAMAQ